MQPFPRVFGTAVVCSVAAISAPLARGWDYEGHRIVNQIALASMPGEFAPFTREPAAKERIAFLSGEPDRWRNTSDGPVKHQGSLEHYFDFEQLAMAGMDPAKVPDLRYDFVVRFAAGRAAQAAAFPAIDPEKNADHTAEWPGFAPWAITESYGRLKSAFSYLKVFQELGTPEEIANAKANAIYQMGVMGHFVGDCAQPLHLSVHHNGWVGENPKGFTRWPGFHAWIDGGFIEKAGIKSAELQPRIGAAKPIDLKAVAKDGRDPMFSFVMGWIVSQYEFVEPLYRLEKSGALKPEAIGKDEAGRKFIEERLLMGGRTLASIWLTAWQQAGPDDYLRTRLLKRAGKPGK